MTYLSNVANERPMLRISATIILAFTCAAPFVLLFSGVVGSNSARCLNAGSDVAFQLTNAAHGNRGMRERQYNRYGKHPRHRSNQGHGP